MDVRLAYLLMDTSILETPETPVARVEWPPARWKIRWIQLMELNDFRPDLPNDSRTWFKNQTDFNPDLQHIFFSPFSWNWNLLGSGVHRTIFLRIFQDWKASRECSKKRCLLSVPKWSIDEINEGRSISIYHVNGGHRSQIHHILTGTKTKYPLVNEQKSLIYRWRVVISMIFHRFCSIFTQGYLLNPYYTWFPHIFPLNHHWITIKS